MRSLSKKLGCVRFLEDNKHSGSRSYCGGHCVTTRGESGQNEGTGDVRIRPDGHVADWRGSWDGGIMGYRSRKLWFQATTVPYYTFGIVITVVVIGLCLCGQWDRANRIIPIW